MLAKLRQRAKSLACFPSTLHDWSMKNFILLLPLLAIACTTANVSTSKEYKSVPKQLYAGSFHKSYQYYILSEPCKATTKDCGMSLELHYFVDSPVLYPLSTLVGEFNYLFQFDVAPEFKLEVNDNELSISNSVGGKWYKFEEKTEGDKSLLWIRIGYEADDLPVSADIVLDLTDPTTPKRIHAETNIQEGKDSDWNEIKLQLKLK